MCVKKAPIGNKINTILQFFHHKLNIGTQYFFLFIFKPLKKSKICIQSFKKDNDIPNSILLLITTQIGVNKRKYRSGLAGEINRPQVLLYPLIESSNIPRYN
jgi:hypothetical protein